MYTSRLIAFLAEFPPRNAHLSTGSAAANAAAYPVTPRCPRGWPPRWASTLLPHSLRWKVARQGTQLAAAEPRPPRRGGGEPRLGELKGMLRSRSEQGFPGRAICDSAEVNGRGLRWEGASALTMTWFSLHSRCRGS